MSYVEKIHRKNGTVAYMVEDSHNGSLGIISSDEWIDIKEKYGVDENTEHLWDFIDKYNSEIGVVVLINDAIDEIDEL